MTSGCKCTKEIKRADTGKPIAIVRDVDFLTRIVGFELCEYLHSPEKSLLVDTVAENLRELGYNTERHSSRLLFILESESDIIAGEVRITNRDYKGRLSVKLPKDTDYKKFLTTIATSISEFGEKADL